MSQTSAPKRDIIEVANVVDGELVTRLVYAVRNKPRGVRRLDAHRGSRLRRATLKRLVKQVKRVGYREAAGA